MTNATAGAQLVEHQYTSGSSFWLIECHDCNIVLNSGHHYSARYLDAARGLADDHNQACHAGLS